MHGGGIVDERFNILSMMEAFHWTYEDYLRRPLWMDSIYQLKLKAEAEYQKQKAAEANNDNGE